MKNYVKAFHIDRLLVLPLIALLVWLTLTFFVIADHFAKNITAITQIIEMGIDVTNIGLVACLFRRSMSKASDIWLLFSVCFLFSVDVLYFIVYSSPHQMRFIFVFDAAHFAYFFFTIMFALLILLKYVLKPKKFLFALLLMVFIDIGIFAVFSIDTRYLSDHISLRNNIQITQSSADLLLFSLAFLWLIYSRTVGSAMIAAGYIVCTASEFMITSCYMTNTIGLLAYTELVWMLGLIFIMAGMVSTIINRQYNTQKWLETDTTIKTSLTFNTFFVVVFSLILFFMILKEFSVVNESFYIFFPTIIMVTTLVITVFSIISSRMIVRPLLQIQNDIETSLNNSEEDASKGSFVLNNPRGYSEIKNIETKIKTLISYVNHQSKNAAIGAITVQVAHDIRSPLVSLQQYVDEINTPLPESDKIFLRNALTTINDIANTMVSRYKGVEQPEIGCHVLIVPCILEVLSAKRMEYKDQNIHFDLVVESPIDHFTLTHTRPAELRRVFSNLLNNAINAMLPEGGGRIRLTVAGSFLGCSIIITDTGCGISEERLADLLSDHPSKQAKIGLGLAHAKAYFKEIAGDFEIKSTPGKGTEVYLSLPKIPDPSWLITHCQIHDETVIIIDDVQSIHDAWQRKLKEIGVKALHFKNPEEFFDALYQLHPPLIIFSDYEFSNSKLNGLDLLSKAPGNALKVLFTSHFSNEKIMQSCAKNGFKLLPKNLFNFFTLEKAEAKEDTNEVNLVFIDDDPANISRWQFFADHKKVKMVAYTRAEDFINEHDQYPRALPIYIDYHLETEKTGMEYAKEIYDLGFKEIFIATGGVNVEKAPWVKAIVEKKFPL